MHIYGEILYHIVVDLILGQGEEFACSPLCPHWIPSATFIYLCSSFFIITII